MTDTTTETKERPAAELVALAAWVNVPSPAHLPKAMRAQSDPHTMAAWRRVAEALIEHGTIDPDAIVRAALERAAGVANSYNQDPYPQTGYDRGWASSAESVCEDIVALASDPAEVAAIIKKAEEKDNG